MDLQAFLELQLQHISNNIFNSISTACAYLSLMRWKHGGLVYAYSITIKRNQLILQKRNVVFVSVVKNSELKEDMKHLIE